MNQFLTGLVNGSVEALSRNLGVKEYLARRGVYPYLYTSNSVGYLSEVPYCSEDGEEPSRFNAWRRHAPSNALVLPIYTLEKVLCGVSLRAMDPSYEKRYDTYIIKENMFPAVFFGVLNSIEVVIEKGWALVVEGPFDYLAAVQFIPNTLAVMTNNMSGGQKRILRRMVPNVVLGFDNEVRGPKRTEQLKKVQQIKIDLEEMGLSVAIEEPVYKDWSESLEKDYEGFKGFCNEINARMGQ